MSKADLIRARGHCWRLFMANAVMLVADGVAVAILDEEPLRSVALVALGWLASGLWKYCRMLETLDAQIGGNEK